MAGRPAAEREALWDTGGLCFPGNGGGPTAADGAAEESAAAGAEGQGEAAAITCSPAHLLLSEQEVTCCLLLLQVTLCDPAPQPVHAHLDRIRSVSKATVRIQTHCGMFH